MSFLNLAHIPSLGPETVIAASSVIIALAALGITCWQASLTRKHNRLSVRPHLAIQVVKDGSVLKVFSKNGGAGPALNLHSKVFFEREIFSDSRDAGRLVDRLKRTPRFSGAGEWGVQLVTGHSVVPGGEFVIIKVDLAAPDAPGFWNRAEPFLYQEIGYGSSTKTSTARPSSRKAARYQAASSPPYSRTPARTTPSPGDGCPRRRSLPGSHTQPAPSNVAPSIPVGRSRPRGRRGRCEASGGCRVPGSRR